MTENWQNVKKQEAVFNNIIKSGECIWKKTVKFLLLAETGL